MKLTIAILLFTISIIANAQEEDVNLKATLKVENTEGLINIEGIVENGDAIYQENLE